MNIDSWIPRLEHDCIACSLVFLIQIYSKKMTTADSPLASQCMDFCYALASQNKALTFSLKIGSTFAFSLATKETLPPADKAVIRKSPSAIRRNARRRTEFLKKKSQLPSSSIGNEAAVDITDMTLAPSDDLPVSAHKVVLNSSIPVETASTPPPTTAPPASSASTPHSPTATSTTTSNTSPSSPSASDWKIVSSKQRHGRKTSPPSSPAKLDCTGPSAPSPETLAANSQVFKCKLGENPYNWKKDCDNPYSNLHFLRLHEYICHCGPYPGPYPT